MQGLTLLVMPRTIWVEGHEGTHPTTGRSRLPMTLLLLAAIRAAVAAVKTLDNGKHTGECHPTNRTHKHGTPGHKSHPCREDGDDSEATYAIEAGNDALNLDQNVSTASNAHWTRPRRRTKLRLVWELQSE